MKVEHHRASSTITYQTQCLDPHAMMRTQNPFSHIGVSACMINKQERIVVRKARNGLLVISVDGKRLDKVGMTSTISSLSGDTLNALNEVLDHYGIQDFTDQECLSTLSGYDDAEETMYRARKSGNEMLAMRTIMRASFAQMPVYMSLLKPELDPEDHILHDFFYDDAETIYSTEMPFMRAATIHEFAYQAFGFWRKDLIKAMAKTTARSIIWVSWFKGGLTPDQTVRVLNHFAEHPLGAFDMSGMDYSLVRGIIRDIQHPTSLFNLALGKHPLDIDKSHTLAVMWADGIKGINVKVNGWEALYERAMRANIENLRGYEARVPEGFNALEENETEGYKVHVLRTMQDYHTTGQTMGVCVGSPRYLKAAHDGEAVHIRFDRDGKMEALLDLRKQGNADTYRVQEFRGQSNSPAPDELMLLNLIVQNTQYEITS